MGGPRLVDDPAAKPYMFTRDQNNVDYYANQFKDLANNLNPLFQQVASQVQGNAKQLDSINTNFTPGGYSPDAFSKGILSQADQARLQQGSVMQKDLNRTFAANPAMAKVLGAQAAATGKMNMNPLFLQTAIAQQGRQADQQTATNNAIAAKFGLQNQAAFQTAQAGALPAQNAQTLLQVLNSLANDRINRAKVLTD